MSTAGSAGKPTFFMAGIVIKPFAMTLSESEPNSAPMNALTTIEM